MTLGATIAAASDEPLHIVLLVDSSNSSRNDPTYKLHASSLQTLIARLLRPGKDRVTLVSFDNTEEVLAAGDDATIVEKAFARLRFGGGTALYDALQYASGIVAAQSTRRVVIVISDGNDTMSTRSPQAAATQLLIDGAAVYILVDKEHVQPSGLVLLRGIAASTGGRVFEIWRKDDIENSYLKIEQDLRAQFRVRFVVPETVRSVPLRMRVAIEGRKILAPQHIVVP